MTKHILVVLIAVFSSITAIAQPLSPVHWNIQAKKIVDNVYALTFEADIDRGWYIYSQHLEEGGPIPTTFNFEENPNIQLLGPVQEVGDLKEGFDKIFEMNIRKYSKKVSFIGLAKVNKPEAILKGSARFMACEEMRCLPPKTETFELVF